MPALLDTLALIVPLLSVIPNVIFFTRDRRTHYLLASLALARRYSFKSISSLLNKTSAGVLPSALGQGHTEQDLRALRESVTLHDRLEIHFYNSRGRGQCLTQKLMLRDVRGQMVGVAEISHDLQKAHVRHPAWQRLMAVGDHTRRHYHRPTAMKELTALSGISTIQIGRYHKQTSHLAPRQMIHRVRLEKTIKLLTGDTSAIGTALQCGYTDHSASSHQFEAMTGSTPRGFCLALLG